MTAKPPYTNYAPAIAEKAAETARARGWEPQEPPPFYRHTPWLMKCVTCGREARLSMLAMTPCDHGDETNRSAKVRQLEETAFERVRAAGWEPIEPFPGGMLARWALRCRECGHEVSRPTTPAQVRPCHHPGQAVERAAVSRDEKERRSALAKAGLRPVEPFPGVGVSWWVECKKAGCRRKWMRGPVNPKPCPHTGNGSPNPPKRQGAS
ncbi:hypothetical protein I3W98_06440 [Streptomyces cavourensis]|nr:hypothetical protein [Streptomyces cavourensis]